MIEAPDMQITQADRDARAKILILAAGAMMQETDAQAAEFEQGIDLILARHRLAGRAARIEKLEAAVREITKIAELIHARATRGERGA
jgi:hypothetical protein